jgi:hypothetical protein
MHGTGRRLKFVCCYKTGVRSQKSDSVVNFDEEKGESKRTTLGDRFPGVRTGWTCP